MLIAAVRSLKFLKRNERGMVLGPGKSMSDYSHPLGAGFHWIWFPFESLTRWNIYAGQEQIIGAEGVAVDTLGEGRLGVVLVAAKEWMATSSEPIASGQNVCVVGFDGPHLRVAVGSHPKTEQELLNEEIRSKLEILESDPSSAFGHWNLGTLYEAKGDSRAAFEEYQKAEKLNPNVRADLEKIVAELKAEEASRKN
ncbi:MAG: hypothetical protein GZ088_11175 [Acidipila sp.]|nr:hypothetical protein [Acidipila sp.]